MKLYLLIGFIAFCLSIFIYVRKSGYHTIEGLLPVYNFVLLLRSLNFSFILIILLSISIIVIPYRVCIITIMYFILPFLIADTYGHKFYVAIFTILCPMLGYPYMAIRGCFYNISDEIYFKRHIITSTILVAFSTLFYLHYTKAFEIPSYLMKTNNWDQTNTLYHSDNRIYNNYLTDQEKKMYNYYLGKIIQHKSVSTFTPSEFKCNTYNDCFSLVNIAFEAIVVDHPELMSLAGYQIRYDGSSDKLTLKIRYALPFNFFNDFGEARSKVIIEQIKKDTLGMSDKEKVKYVYSWMGSNMDYDQTFTDASKNQSIYSVFVSKKAVCAGFAKASQVIFQNIGIKSYAVSGNTSGPHMWNIVELDGKYYYFDSTVATGYYSSSPYYFDGLKQEKMNDYKMDYPKWYPEIEKESAF